MGADWSGKTWQRWQQRWQKRQGWPGDVARGCWEDDEVVGCERLYDLSEIEHS